MAWTRSVSFIASFSVGHFESSRLCSDPHPTAPLPIHASCRFRLEACFTEEHANQMMSCSLSLAPAGPAPLSYKVPGPPLHARFRYSYPHISETLSFIFSSAGTLDELPCEKLALKDKPVKFWKIYKTRTNCFERTVKIIIA